MNKELAKIFDNIPEAEIKRCLEFSKKRPPHPEDIQDKDIEGDVMLQSLNKSVSRVQVSRLLEGNDDGELSYSFRVIVHNVAMRGEKTEHVATLEQNELKKLLESTLEAKIKFEDQFTL